MSTPKKYKLPLNLRDIDILLESLSHCETCNVIEHSLLNNPVYRTNARKIKNILKELKTHAQYTSWEP